MATRNFSDYLASRTATTGLVVATVPALVGSAVQAATIPIAGRLGYINVNTPGRDITLQDCTSERIMRNTGPGSTALLLRPLTMWVKSPSDSSSAGLSSGAISDTDKFYFRVRKEWNGIYTVNGYQPTNKGPVANDAGMVALSGVAKYDYCQNAGTPRIFTGTDPTNATHWVTEGAAGFASGLPKVMIDLGGTDSPNDPNTLTAGHAPVAFCYLQTSGFIDYWGT